MRAALESRLNQIWYRQEPPPWFLRMLVPLYRLVYSFDQKRHLKNRASDLEAKCIIVVGNLTVGGSGKTPLLIHLCELFKAAGFSPAVISRGYGRKDSHQRVVGPDSDPELVGDEPLLIARRCGVPVVVGSSRIKSARLLFAKGFDLVLSDDGLQHRRLPRAIEICVVDGQRGFGNGLMLPAGPLREDLSRLETVDHVVINGSEPADAKQPGLPDGIQSIRMDIHATKVYSIGENLSWRLSQFSGCRVSAVAGISNPDRFFSLLRQARIEVTEHVFPDHHEFGQEDFEKLPDDLPVIMTEKDAVKCMKLKLKNAWYVSIEAHLPSEWEERLIREARGIVHES
ncbi:MAG TPA: tetraacyldisaccharide 4'-kinase [Xanthomonadales bacterium]|nr:tetraacyldisaccharide 4'-kinase [Xanthomonadales bacterium]